MEQLKLAQFLHPSANLIHPPPGSLSLTMLLSRQWDVRPNFTPESAVVMVPGLFYGQGIVRIDDGQTYYYVVRAKRDLQQTLFDTLEVQSEKLSQRMRAILGSGESATRNRLLQQMAQLANENQREASTAYDMTRTPLTELSRLSAALQGRYGTAQSALVAATQLRNSPQAQDQFANIFTLCLIATCDLRGEEDDSDGDESD